MVTTGTRKESWLQVSFGVCTKLIGGLPEIGLQLFDVFEPASLNTVPFMTLSWQQSSATPLAFDRTPASYTTGALQSTRQAIREIPAGVRAWQREPRGCSPPAARAQRRYRTG
jgi:hypothetical protein